MNIKNEISMIDTQIVVELGWANYYGHFNNSPTAEMHLVNAKNLMREKRELILEMEKQERADAAISELKKL